MSDSERPDELTEYLLSLGATAEEIESAGDLSAALATTIVLRGTGERFTRAEAAARAGVPVEMAIRVGRAAGLPDPGTDAQAYGEEDVELLRVIDAGSQLLGVDALFQLIRVIGSACARIADAEVAAFLSNVGAPLMAADPSGLELARANAAAGALLLEAGHAIDVLLRRHVEIAQRPLQPVGQDTTLIAVGFADLVGSTELAEELTIAELGAVIAEFEERSNDTIVDAGGRAVKYIGDAVMFVAPEPATSCAIGLELAAKFASNPRLPPIRVGLAYGDTLSRDGDYFGTIVNVAARIVPLAAPSEVLASAAIETELSGSRAYRFVARGAQPLRGIREPVELFSVERTAKINRGAS